MSKSNCVCRTPTDYKRAIVESIESLADSRSQYDVFCDWIKCTAISIQSSLMIFCDKEQEKIRDEREDEYRRIISQYKDGEAVFGDMMALLIETMGLELSDILGEIYMECDMGNRSTGQFFTPFDVSRAMAGIMLSGQEDKLNNDDVITLYEPACGSGGMIIAAAESLEERNINYQRKLKVVAQDLDWKAVYMCYTSS